MRHAWIIAILVPLWVFESLSARGYDQCDILNGGWIRCENPWEVSVYQYEIHYDGTPEPYEEIYLIYTKWKKEAFKWPVLRTNAKCVDMNGLATK